MVVFYCAFFGGSGGSLIGLVFAGSTGFTSGNFGIFTLGGNTTASFLGGNGGGIFGVGIAGRVTGIIGAAGASGRTGVITGVIAGFD